jgi:hypothetical protein
MQEVIDDAVRCSVLRKELLNGRELADRIDDRDSPRGRLRVRERNCKMRGIVVVLGDDDDAGAVLEQRRDLGRSAFPGSWS